MNQHLCHAEKCKTAVPPSMFMCKKHWFMLPYSLRSQVWDAYRPGQEITKDPSSDYLNVTQEAINYIKDKEST